MVLLGLVALVSSAVTPVVASDDSSALAERLNAMKPAEQLELLRGMEAQGQADAEVYFRIGNAFYSMEALDSAIVYYGEAIKADSAYVKAWVNLGLAYDGSHQVPAAQRAFEEALAIAPDDVLALCHLGFTYFNRGRVEKAIDYYMQALRIDPESAQAHYNLGLAFADAHIFQEALREWEKVIELDDGQLGKTAAENVNLIHTYMELDEN
jgi:superkiller protein 3